jgi:hypothetical protein
MESLIVFVIHLIVLALVLGLLWWLVNVVCGVLPPPIARVFRVGATVVFVLIAISWLLGDVGAWGTWGYGYRHHWL